MTLNTVVEIPKLRPSANGSFALQQAHILWHTSSQAPSCFYFRRAIPSLPPTETDSTKCPQSLGLYVQLNAASAIASSPQSIAASTLSPRLHLPTKVKASPNPFRRTSHQTRFYGRCMPHRSIAKCSGRFLSIQLFRFALNGQRHPLQDVIAIGARRQDSANLYNIANLRHISIASVRTSYSPHESFQRSAS